MEVIAIQAVSKGGMNYESMLEMDWEEFADLSEAAERIQKMISKGK